MHVPVGHLNAFVTQHIFNLNYIEATTKQECRARMAQPVKMNGVLKSGLLAIKFELCRNSPAR